MHARDILLLAAEDAFEYERWREAGPLTADVDPEVRAAEIVEFEALGIPLPRELDSLRREMEFSSPVREAIRSAVTVLRRNGQAEAGALVELGPQALIGAGWGIDPRLIDPRVMDPRFADPRFADPRSANPRASDPRFAARSVEPRVGDPRPQPSRRHDRDDDLDDPDELDDDDDELAERGERRHADPVEPELVDGFDDDLDEPPRPRARERRPPASTRARSNERRAKPRARAWDEDDDADDSRDSLIAMRPTQSRNQAATWVLGGIAGVLAIALLVIAFDKDDKHLPATGDQQALQQPPAPPAQQPQPSPPAPLEPLPTDPALADPAASAVAPAPVTTPTSRGSSPSGSRGSGLTGVRGGGAPAPAAKPSSGLTPFADLNTKLAGGEAPSSAPAPASTTPAPAGATPAPAGTTPAPAPAEAAPPPAPIEQPKPAEPLPEPELTKSKMTPAIRSAITGKVSDLQRCYNEALIAKPDLAGKVVFTISIDQDGVVKRVEVGKDEVGNGVASCAAKQIRTWTLPSAGIPIIFDLPFDFQQPKG